MVKLVSIYEEECLANSLYILVGAFRVEYVTKSSPLDRLVGWLVS